MSWLQDAWDWIVDHIPFIGSSGIGSSVERIEITKMVYAPLFYPKRGVTTCKAVGDVDGTWDWLKKSDEDRAWAIAWIKAHAPAGTQPMVTFLLSSSGNDGGIMGGGTSINDSALSAARDVCVATIKEGVALAGTLYCDDADPRWRDIAKHATAWQTVNEKLGNLLSVALLSIESDEKEDDVNAKNISAGVAKVKEYFPDVPLKGTHMQFHKRSASGTYAWIGWVTNPTGCDVMFMEFPWNMGFGNGDVEGVAGVQRDYPVIAPRMNTKVCWQEINLNPTGPVAKAQTQWLLAQKPWGVG